MKFVCLGYAEMSQFTTTPEEELKQKMDECFGYDRVLMAAGHFVGGEALQDPSAAKTLRFVEGQVVATDGPYAETKEQLGGILFLEANDMAHAVELMSKHPGVRIGPFEIRPADEQINAMIKSGQGKDSCGETTMFAKPQSQHQWLESLVGQWSFEHACTMPDGTTSTTLGKMRCRSLGGMWLICESEGQSTDGSPWSSIMTVGFDVTRGRYVGTFIGSMMSNVWQYEGDVDESGKRLPLHCQGPAMDGKGVCPYRDTIEIIDQDQWRFTSEMQTADGMWIQFLDGMHRRIGH